MRILFLTPNFPPEVNAGASRTAEHCRRWADAGHEVTVVAPAPNWPRGRLYGGYRNHWRSEERVDGVRVVRVWTFIHPNNGLLGRMLSFVSFMLRATWEAWRLRREADVMVATSPHFFSGQAGMLVKWLTGLPFVLEIRDIWPESVVAVGAMRRSLLLRFVERLEQAMYRAADHIVTVGDGYRRKLLDRSVPDEKISLAPNGVDLTRWFPTPPEPEVRRRYRGRNRFVCTYVGTVGLAHGLEVVLRAAAALKKQNRDDVVFWIVGDGARRAALEEEAAALGLENVIFTGQVGKSEVATIISSSDACLVHLRGAELFGSVIPSKIFEIMAMQTPILMGVRGDALDLVLTANAGVEMEPEDELSLLQGIARIHADRNQFRRGRGYVAKHFNRDKSAAGMLEVLKATAVGRRGAEITGSPTDIEGADSTATPTPTTTTATADAPGNSPAPNARAA